MKKFNMKLKIRKLSAVLLASAVAATAFLTLPFVASAATIDTSKFTAYFSEDMSTTDPAPADFNRYWETTTDGDALKYKDMDLSDWNNQTRKNMATLYYNVKEYSNFEVTFNYKQTSNTHLLSFFFGFGAEMGQNWYKDRDSVAAYSLLMDHGALMSCHQESWLSDGNNRGAAQIPSYSATAAHTIKVKYVSGAVSVYMDGYQIYSGTKTVNPGYIWFASKAGTTVIYEPTVTELKSISDFENVYDAYYSSDMTSVDPAPETMTNHWGLTSDTTRLSRKTNDSSWTRFGPNMAILYLKKTYNNFDLTTTFSIPGNSDYDVYFGVGAEKGKSWANDNAAAFTLHRSGGLMNGKAENWITGGGQTPADKISGYNITGVHTLRLKVVEKVYTAWVDDIQVGSGTLSNYTEGYVWFGADDMTATWGIPTVTELKSISDYENVFDSYYSSDMKTVDPAPETMTNHWGLTSDTERLAHNDNDSNWAKYGPNMAVLYLKENYYNFDLTTSFSITDNVEGNGYFGIGAEKGKSWTSDTTSSVFTFHTSGGLMNGKTGDWITGPGETPADKITDYNKTGVHTLRVKVLDKVYTVWVDGVQIACGTIQNYKGGYIWFGADDRYSSWGVPTVTKLPNNELLKYDVNGDNAFDSGDVVFLRKVLLGIEEANQKCDISGDNKLNILDLIAMKKVLS